MGRDLLRENDKKYEVLLIILFLVFLLFLFSEALLFVSFFWTTFHSFSFTSLEISCSFLIFFSLFSFILAWTFISLQIIEFRIMGLSINDSFYSCVFFFLTGLHFFHLVLGLLLISLFYWGSSFSSKIHFIFLLRSSEIHLFYNQLFFYWHFVEVLWLFIFL